MPFSLSQTVTLRSGAVMPLYGLGTWLSAPGECKIAVQAALKAGYKLIDTAAMYENEADVGAGLKSSGLKRDDFFVVTKLLPKDHGEATTKAALKESLAKLGLDYVDLYLIHTPNGGKVLETWKAMLALKAEGLARCVGVSNFGVKQLEGIKNEGLELPEVNQIELHVWLQQKETVEWCKSNAISIMGYCPLARCKQFGETKLVDIAKKLGKTEAQVALRWSAQSGYITIPKSVNETRIKENASLDFDISEDDMKTITTELDVGFKASRSVNTMDLPWDTVKDSVPPS